MPVTCVSVLVMPRVAKGARRHAWNVSPGSCMGLAPGERTHLRKQLLRHLQTLAPCALAQLPPPIAGQAHARILAHRGDERLHALVEDVVARERARVDREDRLPDARGPALLGEEAVGLESECRARKRADEEL